MCMSFGQFKNVILLLFITICMASCGKSKDSRWIKTEEGVLYFLPEAPSLLSFGDYYWSGDSVDGLAYGKGTLKYVDNWSDKNNYTISGFAYFGSIDRNGDDELYFVGPKEDGMLNGFAVWSRNGKTIVSEFKKGKAKGTGKIYQDTTLVYSGELKDRGPHGEGKLFADNVLLYEGSFKDELYDGKGTLYYPNGKTKYEGKFKKGLYDGEGQYFTEEGFEIYDGKWSKGRYNGRGTIRYDSLTVDSIGYKPTDLAWTIPLLQNGEYEIDPITGAPILVMPSDIIYESHDFKNGQIKPENQALYDKLNNHIKDFTVEQYDSIYSRISFWENYGYWIYIIASVILLVLWIILLSVNYIEDFKGYDGNVIEKASLYRRIKKWNCWKVYPTWLLLGWFGFHRAQLKSYWSVVYGALFTIIIILNLQNISLYLFWPSCWHFMEISGLSLVLIYALGIFLLFDLGWILWRCYWLNHTYYRHDARELALVSTQSTDIDYLINDVKPTLSSTIANLKTHLNRTKEIQRSQYDGPKSSFNLKRLAGVFTGDDKWAKFEMQRMRSLESLLRDYTDTQQKFAIVAENMNIYLQEARENAYRNINLAKELIGWLRKFNAKETILQTDRKISEEVVQFDFAQFEMPDIQLGMDVEATFNNCVNTTKLLMTCGLRLGPSLAIGAAISVLSGIADAIQKANKLCEAANEKAQKAVWGIGQSLDQIVRAEKDILRAYEILASLYHANRAFTNAYVALRDDLLGEEPSFAYFIRGGVIRPKRNIIEDLVHLQQVTSEYNKINQAKL